LTIVWISVLPAGVALLDTYTQVRLANDPATPAIALIANSGPEPKTIVMSSNRVYRRLSPAARPIGETLLLPIAKHVPEEVRVKWLNDLAARGPFWFIADEGDPASVDENRNAHAFASEQLCKVDTQWGGSALVSRFVGRNGTPLPVTTSALLVIDRTDGRAVISVDTARGRHTVCRTRLARAEKARR
jgi:hypothetical protein